LRRWFGPDAGLPGTAYLVAFNREDNKYVMRAVNLAESHNSLELWCSYSREQIPMLFGEQFVRARWQTGFITLPKHILLLMTLDKSGMEGVFQYQDRFLALDIIEWQSQNRTSRQSDTG
jgi:hypothetical protein